MVSFLGQAFGTGRSGIVGVRKADKQNGHGIVENECAQITHASSKGISEFSLLWVPRFCLQRRYGYEQSMIPLLCLRKVGSCGSCIYEYS